MGIFAAEENKGGSKDSHKLEDVPEEAIRFLLAGYVDEELLQRLRNESAGRRLVLVVLSDQLREDLRTDLREEEGYPEVVRWDDLNFGMLQPHLTRAAKELGERRRVLELGPGVQENQLGTLVLEVRSQAKCDLEIDLELLSRFEQYALQSLSEQKHVHVLEFQFVLNFSDNPLLRLKLKDLRDNKIFELRQIYLTDLLHPAAQPHLLQDNLILQNLTSQAPGLELRASFRKLGAPGESHSLWFQSCLPEPPQVFEINLISQVSP